MCTIIARNYLAQARVLCDSYRRFHPDHAVVTLIVDASEHERSQLADGDGRLGEIVLCEQLPIDRADIDRMRAMYSVLELCTALKPSLLRWVLDRLRCDSVLYLDPDCLVTGELGGVHEAAAVGVAVTPHVLHPMPRDGRLPDEESIRHSGIFNLGVVAVTTPAAPLLDWWAQRMTVEAAVDLPKALFTDQRWMDWLPALTTPAVVRDHGVNVAYWNLHERPLHHRDGSLFAGPDPLRLMHFSGFDPDTPWILSRYTGQRGRVNVSATAELSSLCRRYAALLVEARQGTVANAYGWAQSVGGIRLDELVRSILRLAVQHAEAAGSPRPTFSPLDDESLYAVIDEFVTEHGPVPLPRWALASYGFRADLRAAFPNLHGADAWGLLDWAEHEPHAAVSRADSGLRPLRPTARPRAASDREAGGWNVVGHLSGQFGIGESARRTIHALDLTGVPLHLVDCDAAETTRRPIDTRPVHRSLRYRDTIYCVNADMIASTITVLEGTAGTQARGRRVALWYWELETAHPDARRAAELVDEVWVTSQFTADAFRAAGVDPVHLLTLPAVAAPATTHDPATFGLGSGFVVVTLCDLHSVVRRKNPQASIAAFTRAFPTPGEAQLVVKTNHGAAHPNALEQLLWAIQDRGDITLIDGTWHPAAVASLVGRADCLLSLHRSEGFGLNLIDAIAAGTPVITTGYGGNMQFCSADTVGLVPFELVAVGDDAHPYMPDARWAEPDVDAAAALLRDAYARPAWWKERATQAKGDVLATHAPARTVEQLRHLLDLPAEIHRLADRS